MRIYDREHGKIYRQEHKEEEKERHKKYYDEQKKKILERARERRKLPEVREKNTERARRYNQSHREKVNAYQRKYQNEHRNYYVKWARERKRELKKWAVDKLGRKCFDCGLESKFDFIYDLHHENEAESWSHFQNVNKTDMIRIRKLKEWQKADKIPNDIKLLCANCHRIRHYGDLNE
jgi:predicted HNH restriction endonuclease